jgi:hypothetical protein
MRHLPRSTILLASFLVALVAILLGFAVARRTSPETVQTGVAHQLVGDFQNHLGVGADHGLPVSVPGCLEVLLLVLITLVGVLLWRSWPSPATDARQQRSDRPRS